MEKTIGVQVDYLKIQTNKERKNLVLSQVEIREIIAMLKITKYRKMKNFSQSILKTKI